MEAVIATTTNTGFYNHSWQKVRTECSIKFFEECQRHNFQVVTVDRESSEEFLALASELRVDVVKQPKNTMLGDARKLAIEQASNLAGVSGVVIWCEPEKYTFIKTLHSAIDKFETEKLDLLMFNRKSMKSYPKEQALHYEYINLAAKYFAGVDCDFAWGPMVLSSEAVEHFSNYDGKWGNLWDAIHCPKLSIISSGMRWNTMDVDYVHPTIQREAEEGVLSQFREKIDRVEFLCNAIINEAERLKMNDKKWRPNV